MKKYLLSTIIITLFIVACNKNDSSSLNPVVGTWGVRSTITGPLIYVPGYGYIPQANSNLTVAQYNGDSLYLKFDNAGNYYLSLPYGEPPVAYSGTIPVFPTVQPVTGTYKIVQDSFLIIQSDTSYLLKSTYNFRVNAPFPNSDTIRFNRVSPDSLELIQSWVTDSISQPQDTIKVSLTSISRFKKM